MNKYMIFTESTTDLGNDMIKSLDIQVIPLTFTIGGVDHKEMVEEGEMTYSKFYKRLRNGEMSSTSQVNVSGFEDAFSPFLEDGYDILHLAFSSGLSGTCDSAKLAAEKLGKKYPERKIIVIDTLAASLGQGLLVWHAVQMKNEGSTIEKTADWVEKNKLNLAHWFTVDDLVFLKRGGRLSGAVALIGTVLGIKPVLHVDNDGHLINVSKIRGRKNSLNALVNKLGETGIKPKNQMIFVSHGDCIEDAEYVAKEVKRKFGTSKLYINFIGPVIGSHSGPGTVALFFLAEKR
ncbi:MAG: DegV family protein [Ruminococcaceae bacterium]|nr:DegV family protein [Oscillospiraceae bacterium]